MIVSRRGSGLHRASSLLAGVLLAGSLARGAEPLTWVVPPSAIPAGGASLIAGGAAPRVVEGGAIRPASGWPEVYEVVPSAGATGVLLEHGGRSVRLAVGPPSATVHLSLSPPSPVKGRDTEAWLTVEVRDADGKPAATSAPPVVRANVGAVEALELASPGRYRARYVLPSTRYPEVAVVVAFAAWPHPQSIEGAVGALRVAMPSAVEVPGRTEASADMSLTIAGQTFGPVRADATGAFRVPVVVPPGHGAALGTAVDRLGNRRSVQFDLHLPRTDQLSCVATPAQLPAEATSRARVWCATSDPFGGVARGAKVQLTASSGTVSAPRDVADGVVEWTWAAPTHAEAAFVTLQARWRQGPALESKDELSLELLRGPVARVEWAQAPTWAAAGSAWRATLSCLDAEGRPVAGVMVDLGKSGHAEVSDATGRASVVLPVEADTAWGPRTVPLAAAGPFGHEPARLHVWGEGSLLLGAVADLSGRLVPHQPVDWDGRALQTGDDGVAVLGDLSARGSLLVHRVWPGLATVVRVDGGRVYPGQPPRGRVAVTARFHVVPAAEVSVHVARGARGPEWWLEDAAGQVLDGREVEVRLGDASRRVVSRGRQAIDVTAGTAWSVTDVLTRAVWAGEGVP